jgi:site-specific DNA-methyltransferase (adenine-specific)
MNIELNKIYNMDCLEGMKHIPNKSVDMILCDLPYGTTKAKKWDVVIPFDLLWEQYERIIKDNGAIVLTSQQPFTSHLILSNLKLYRYNWVWDKVIGTNYMNAKKMHTKGFEDICVFYKKPPIYKPIMETGEPFDAYKKKNERQEKAVFGSLPPRRMVENFGTRYPKGIIRFSARNNKPIHNTQKPVSLFEYLIKTYSDENDIILDNCMGSGTTAIASINTSRNFIGFELNEEFFNKSIERIEEHKSNIKEESK